MLDVLSEPVNRYRLSDRVITYCNQAWADHYSVAREEAMGRRVDEFLSPDELDGLWTQLERIGPEHPVLVDEVARVDSGAEQRWLQWVDHYVVTDLGPEVMSVGRDVTAHHLAERALAESEKRFRSLADASSDVVWRMRGPEWRFDYLSPSVTQMLGFEPAHFIDDFEHLLAIADPDTRALIDTFVAGEGLPDRFDLWFRHANGELVIIETSTTRSDDAIHGVGRDVTEIRLVQASLARTASTDSLTGLANRRAFDGVLVEQLALSEQAGTHLAVVYLDLDDLKVVNDRYGHDAGDLVLQTAARRLVASVDGPDLVARLGGDEFAIIHEVVGDSVDRLVERINRGFHVPIRFTDSTTVVCTASIGVAETSRHGREAGRLVAAADAAMYLSKQRRGIR